EFRAVGSSQSISGPNTVLNTIVAESLDLIATALEKSKSAGKDLNRAVQELLPGIIKECKKVLYDGDNYIPEWHAEAERRGLPNLRNSVDAMPAILEQESIELFTKYRVYTKRELESRFTILLENYIKTVMIEARCMSMMAKTMILPAALRYLGQVAQSVQALRGAGVEPQKRETELVTTLNETVGQFQGATDKLDHALGHHADGDVFAHAKYARDHVVTAMADLRKLGDKLETMVADDLWPLPTYREMLFMK